LASLEEIGGRAIDILVALTPEPGEVEESETLLAHEAIDLGNEFLMA